MSEEPINNDKIWLMFQMPKDGRAGPDDLLRLHPKIKLSDPMNSAQEHHTEEKLIK